MSPLFPTPSTRLACLEHLQSACYSRYPQLIVLYHNVSCTENLFPNTFHYPSAHLTCLPITHLSCCTWCLTGACNGWGCGSNENQGSLENRSCIQGAPLCDSFLILSRFSLSWRVMALLGQALCCADNLDVLESESPSLEMTHFRVFLSAITKSLSKLILMKWPLVKVEITLIKTERREKASETFSQLCEWILLPHSLPTWSPVPNNSVLKDSIVQFLQVFYC